LLQLNFASINPDLIISNHLSLFKLYKYKKVLAIIIACKVRYYHSLHNEIV